MTRARLARSTGRPWLDTGSRACRVDVALRAPARAELRRRGPRRRGAVVVIAERAVELRLSRRWLLVASLIAHVAIIAVAIGPRYERMQTRLVFVGCALMRPPPPQPRASHACCGPARECLECAHIATAAGPACPAPTSCARRHGRCELVPADGWCARRAVTRAARARGRGGVHRSGREVTWTTPTRSTGDACVDEQLAVVKRTWRYQPLGYAACAEVTIR